jgi:hypothetical protein
MGPPCDRPCLTCLRPTLPPAVTVRFPLTLFGVPHQVGPLAFRTAGDAIDLPFDLSIESLQRWTLVYLGLSSLVFVVVWVLGYLRR